MKKELIAISIIVAICMLLCSCWKNASNKNEPVQESKTIDIPNESEIDSSDDQTDEENESFSKTDEADANAGEEQGEKETRDFNQNSQQDNTSAPSSTIAENVVTIGDSTEVSQPVSSDNNGSETNYDENELPEY